MENHVFLEGSNCLVTGGLGFIGSRLARALVNAGSNVTIVDSQLEGAGANWFNIDDIRDSVQVNIADISDRTLMDELLPYQNYVFNLAASISHLDSMENPLMDLHANAGAHLSLLESCRHTNPDVRVVFASTRQVYGKPQSSPVDENHPVKPVDVNGINKWSAEEYHRLYHETYGLPVVTLRLSNVYGPGQLVSHNRQGFIGWFLRLAIENKTITVFGDGLQYRDLVYVDDVVEAFIAAARAHDHQNAEVYNVSGAKAVSLADIAELLTEICPGASWSTIPFPEGREKIDIGSYQGDISRIGRDLAWSPKTSLEDGLRASCEYLGVNFEHYVEKA